MQGMNKKLPPVPTQWGAPLTGAQMQRLQDAGLRACGFKMTGESQVDNKGVVTKTYDKYHLPADHPAYTLLEAGWLDGRNVALWFGGEKAPDDWDGKHVLLRKGLETWGADDSSWVCAGDEADIIAYTRKAEGLTTHADRALADAERMAKRMGGELGQNELWGASGEAASIAKMTEAEVSEVAMSHRMTTAEVWGAIKFCRSIGLIKPEQTRLERFWSTRDTKDVYGPPCKAFQLIEEALNFER